MQYQDFLLEEFRSRRSRNPHYSLRAFARDLDMPASKLSQNLRGLCGISVIKAEKIAGRLQMRDDEKQLFLALVESQHARSRVARQQATNALAIIHKEKLDELSLEKFAAVRDWYHMAILEMTDIKGFRSESKWIAEKLGLPEDLVAGALDRLQKLELLRRDESKLVQTHIDLEVPGGTPSRALREHHKQIMTKGIAALDVVDESKIEYSSQTFAVNTQLYSEIKDLLRQTQRQVNKIAQAEGKDAVYVLSIQLFPLAESEKDR